MKKILRSKSSVKPYLDVDHYVCYPSLHYLVKLFVLNDCLQFTEFLVHNQPSSKTYSLFRMSHYYPSNLSIILKDPTRSRTDSRITVPAAFFVTQGFFNCQPFT